MAVGMLCVLLVGGIDISVGSTLALSGMASAMLMRDGILPNAFSAYLFSIGVGLVCGILVGVVIAKGGVLPIIASLGFMYVFRGLTFFISGGRWVGMVDLLDSFRGFSQGTTFAISNLLWMTLGVYVVLFVILKWTKLGRQIYAVGSSPDSAQVRGINISRVKIFVYALNGSIAGLGGAMFVGYYANAMSNMATGIELDVIAACVIGGVSLKGGQGTVPGVLIGALIMVVINRSLSLVGIDPFWQACLKGAVILAAVVANILIQRNATRRNLESRVI
jgi:rhamnose transport system permease protein